MGNAGLAPEAGPECPREGYISLLADERKLAIMRALGDVAPRDTALPPARLARSLEVSERRVRHHLSVLARCGVVVRVTGPWRSYRVAWKLNEAGRELLELHELIVGCERRLAERGDWAPSRPLVQALHSMQMRAILSTLAGASLALVELERRLPHMPHTTLEHSLRRLGESGVVDADGTGSGGRRYQLRQCVRPSLARIALSGVHWRLRFRPDQPPWSAGDLLGLLVLLAPIVHVAPGVHGVCVMQALPMVAPTADGVRWPDAHVSVVRRRISPRANSSPQPIGPPPARQARVWASDLAWCEALLSGDFGRIEMEGEHELAHALLAALAAAVRA